ncbi:MAG: alpha/beta hydrolase-fold protein [Bifidobacterium sp.]|nr:alpha/beta hydrolase-fold protein [Bifidobacterium sp.]
MAFADGWKDAVASVRITEGWLPITVWALILGGMLVLGCAQVNRGRRKALAKEFIIALIVGLVGLGITWFLSNGIVAFGVELGWDVIIAVGVGLFFVGFFLGAAILAHGWRRAVAIVLIPVSLIGTGIRVDTIYGEFQTLGSLVDYSPYPHISSVKISTETVSMEQYRKQVKAGLEDVPSEGKLLSVDIPNTESGFKARKAMVWLPPAALAKHPPKLPVMVMLAGNPGSPTRYFNASTTMEILNEYAAKHDGLAPIVVSPDQNTSNTKNSLCSDTTKVGKAETYLTVDVPDWIRKNLPVSERAADWTIGGFSQGGTCSTQIGPNHPDLFGNVLAVDGELHPTDGSVESMVENYFGGDKSLYERQVPTNALKAHAPSTQTMILAAGANDLESINNIKTIGAAAKEAGWTVVEFVVKDTGHDWHAVNHTLEAALPWLCERQGLGSVDTTFADYSALEELQ